MKNTSEEDIKAAQSLYDDWGEDWEGLGNKDTFIEGYLAACEVKNKEIEELKKEK